jgi:Wiskott-Aldrich syndrome protein
MSKSSQKFQSAHNPSVLLSLEENNSIFSLLSRGQTALATSVIQLLITSPPTHKEWQLFATGVMCFVKHNQKRSYFFRLYDFDEKKMIWEQEIYLDMNYQQLEPYFHMLEAEDCMAGLNFADERDAQHFGLVVRKKADLINKMLRTKDKPNKDRLKEDSIRKIDNNSLKVPNISSMRTRSLDSLQTANQNFINIEKSNSKSKLKISKLDIGSPTDFRHIQHIGWSPSTGFDLKVIDPKLQNFFEIAGVSADLLDDIDTRKFIFSFIDTHGGIETAIQEATNQQTAKVQPKNVWIYKIFKNL